MATYAICCDKLQQTLQPGVSEQRNDGIAECQLEPMQVD